MTAAVVHVVGAEEGVEDQVPWDCASTPTIVLVGPTLTDGSVSGCTTSVRGLYRTKLVSSKPDLVFIPNSDVFDCMWRRTLFSIVRSGVTAIATFNDEYEAIAAQHLLNVPSGWDEKTGPFAPTSLGTCDMYTRSLYKEQADELRHDTDRAGIDVVAPRLLWPTNKEGTPAIPGTPGQPEPNPNAPAAGLASSSTRIPTDEDSATGPRNMWWLAFRQEPEKFADKDEP